MPRVGPLLRVQWVGLMWVQLGNAYCGCSRYGILRVQWVGPIAGAVGVGTLMGPERIKGAQRGPEGGPSGQKGPRDGLCENRSMKPIVKARVTN